MGGFHGQGFGVDEKMTIFKSQGPRKTFPHSAHRNGPIIPPYLCPSSFSAGELLINMVNKATSIIMGRLQGLAAFETGESKVTTLIAAADCKDNLARMDPTWHPWL